MPAPDAKFELQIGGTWTDVTDKVRMASRITHSRGRRSQGARTEAAEVGLTLESPDGLFNNRNPRSPYFGLLGRNTPARLTVDGTVPFLDVTTGTSGASTPDAAALDITGDIDIRFEATLSNWLKSGGVSASVELCGKGLQTGNQRSWLLLMRDRRLHFEWSAAGTTTIEKESTADLPVPPSGHIAVRVTLDVNNGAAGNTVTFYTSDSVSGTWTQLGDPVITAGTTSIFNSTASVRVGDGWSDLTFEPAAGRIHAFELRNGIAGSAVANPDFSAATPGASTLVDGTGKTWTLFGSGVFTSRRVRCLPEVSKWPPKWHISGHNVTVPIQAAGIKRRLEAGRKSLQSTLRRRIPSEASCVAYWPMEEDSEATQAYSPLTGVPPLMVTGFDFAADDSLLGSSALPRLVGGTSISMEGRVPTHTDTGNWMVSYVYWFEADPATATEILEFNTTGTVRRITVTLEPGGIAMRGYGFDGTEIMFVLLSPATNFFGTWNRLEIIATTTGADVAYHLGWIDVSGGGFGTSDTITATAGIVSRINTRWGASGDGMRLGHLGVFNTNNTLIYDGADDGFQGELAAARVTRLTGEEAVPATVHQGDTTAMGAQRPGQLLTLLEDCEDSDGGILYEDRERLALMYRPRTSLYNQTPALTLDYGELTQPFEPVEEDNVRNDFTVQRAGGSSARVPLEEGALSVQEPPNGIGPYEAAVPLSLHRDTQTEQIAAWLLALSTWDEDRYPRVRLLLHKYPALIPEVLDLVEGDIIRITNLPDHLVAGPIDLILEGFEEKLGEFEWELIFVCSPGGPWTVGVLDDDVLGRLDTDGSELAVAVDADDTAWSVAVTDGPLWITTAGQPTEFPFDLMVGGERVTATASAPSVRDTFTRSVTDGWGSPTVGPAWTNTGGTAANFDVTGTLGTHTLTTVNASRRSLLASASADFNVLVDVASNDLASGGSQFAGPVARAVDADNLYQARLEFTTGGAVILAIRKRLTATETELITFTTSLTHVAGTFYRVRFQGQGSTLRARVWLAAGTEPTFWQAAATDTSLTAAANVGVRSILAVANTDVSPIVSYDNFALGSPASFTVVRSVNGIAKSHAAGASIVLADPLRLAL
ncbi:hypothetical protein [Streptomyces lunaelactis]|uniref:hypothetical protein n=1 Tax=Streptomyces lunaelactis TaxID=1535768 RepID=UPI00158487C7|nr:hypothetical protein [Streptomyces lunaelactis]NUK22075.1 hypothetical protein [Streptomyces lunaelactis]